MDDIDIFTLLTRALAKPPQSLGGLKNPHFITSAKYCNAAENRPSDLALILAEGWAEFAENSRIKPTG